MTDDSMDVMRFQVQDAPKTKYIGSVVPVRGRAKTQIRYAQGFVVQPDASVQWIEVSCAPTRATAFKNRIVQEVNLSLVDQFE